MLTFTSYPVTRQNKGDVKYFERRLNITNAQQYMTESTNIITKNIQYKLDNVILRKGWFMCIEKTKYKPIPENIVLFYGDTLLYDMMRMDNYKNMNIYPHFIYHNHGGSNSVQSKNNKYIRSARSMGRNDELNYKKYLKEINKK
jgi:hypothetical protein